MLDTLCVGRRSTSIAFGWCCGTVGSCGVCGVSARCWVLRKRLSVMAVRSWRVLFSWCCPSPGALCGVFGGGVGVLFENCIVDASIFVVFKNFTGFCVSF